MADQQFAEKFQAQPRAAIPAQRAQFDTPSPAAIPLQTLPPYHQQTPLRSEMNHVNGVPLYQNLQAEYAPAGTDQARLAAERKRKRRFRSLVVGLVLFALFVIGAIIGIAVVVVNKNAVTNIPSANAAYSSAATSTSTTSSSSSPSSSSSSPQPATMTVTATTTQTSTYFTTSSSPSFFFEPLPPSTTTEYVFASRTSSDPSTATYTKSIFVFFTTHTASAWAYDPAVSGLARVPPCDEGNCGPAAVTGGAITRSSSPDTMPCNGKQCSNFGIIISNSDNFSPATSILPFPLFTPPSAATTTANPDPGAGMCGGGIRCRGSGETPKNNFDPEKTLVAVL